MEYSNLECCALGCHTRPNQGLRFYRFPCHNPQISSIWKQRICRSENVDIDIVKDHVCELHFDYRCKTGNECALEEGSLPTLHLPSFGSLLVDNANLKISVNTIEEPSYVISIDALSYHCRLCLRRGLLYEVEASTYRSKSFLSLIDLPPNMLPDNTRPNACLCCLKSIVIAHQLSIAVEHSSTILQQLIQHPKQSKVVSNNNYFDIKSELAFCNLILANSISIKLEIEFEDNIICGNEEYEQKWVVTGESTSPAAYVNTENIIDKSMYVSEFKENVSKMHDSLTSDKQCQKEFHKSFAIGAAYKTDLSAEGILYAIDNSDSSVLIENKHDNAEVLVSNNSDASCAVDRQLNNDKAAELTGKTVIESTYKCDLCKFTTNYKANLAIHKILHLAGYNKEHFYCQKCEKYFMLRRHFVRHNTIVHTDDFTCNICDKPHASVTKLAVHYTEDHNFQCDISSSVLKSGHRSHMLDYKQVQRKSSTPTENNIHWNENNRVYVCSICDWKNPSLHTFNVHMGKHVQVDKNSDNGSEELETLETDPVRIADGPIDFRNESNLSEHKRIHSNERSYKCTECPKTFGRKIPYDMHKRKHTIIRPYKYTECPNTFIQKSNLDTHKGIHTNEKPYKCTECPKTFNRKSALSAHRKIHTNRRPYKCSECPKAFTFMSVLSVHKKTHTNERPYKCVECQKTFSLKSRLDIHKRLHTNERPHKCTEYPKTFTTKGNLYVHKRIHTNEKPYKCTECRKTFSQKNQFTVHKRIHTNERPYKCSECPKAFTYKSVLSVHKKTHTNERPYKCAECLKTFILKSSLDIHKKSHTNERPYKCAECLKTFGFKSSLNTHQRSHTNERPYKCTECPKTFTTKGNLYVHKRIHTNERPYKCTECPKTFTTKGNLYIHKRIHTNERPYKCSECSKTFTTKGNLYIHKRIHTNERPYKCSECPKNFITKGNLDIHERIHKHLRLYKCIECPKTFITKGNLDIHKRIHMN